MGRIFRGEALLGSAHSLLYPTLAFAPLAGAASPFGDAQGVRRCQNSPGPAWLRAQPQPQPWHCQALLNGHHRVQFQPWNALCCESLPGPANICSDIGTALANIAASKFSALLEYSWEANVRRGTAQMR